jgi:putative pyruvate formate lyase activating enzyme
MMMDRFTPSYLKLLENGILGRRAEEAHALLGACHGCANHCGVDRLRGEFGACRTGPGIPIASYGAHHGEEDVLRGWNGSGTVFFARCNLRCLYCQNHDISQPDSWPESSPEALAEVMLELQHRGCHNINLVSPSHIVPQIIEAVAIAAEKGLNLPLVYNTGGYDSMEALQLLEGIIDIYMPDMKYASEENGRKYSGIPEYPRVNQAAVKAMHDQVGDLVLDEDGLAVRGLLVRHLVLPNGIAGSQAIIRFLAEEISRSTWLNIMDQYYPAYLASEFPELSRRITNDEYVEVVSMAKEAGLLRLDKAL